MTGLDRLHRPVVSPGPQRLPELAVPLVRAASETWATGTDPSKKQWSQVCRELREICTAPTLAAAEARFGEFAETWRAKYPAMIETWRRSWGEFVPFLEFPIELRRLV